MEPPTELSVQPGADCTYYRYYGYENKIAIYENGLYVIRRKNSTYAIVYVNFLIISQKISLCAFPMDSLSQRPSVTCFSARHRRWQSGQQTDIGAKSLMTADINECRVGSCLGGEKLIQNVGDSRAKQRAIISWGALLWRLPTPRDSRLAGDARVARLGVKHGVWLIFQS